MIKYAKKTIIVACTPTTLSTAVNYINEFPYTILLSCFAAYVLITYTLQRIHKREIVIYQTKRRKVRCPPIDMINTHANICNEFTIFEKVNLLNPILILWYFIKCYQKTWQSDRTRCCTCLLWDIPKFIIVHIFFVFAKILFAFLPHHQLIFVGPLPTPSHLSEKREDMHTWWKNFYAASNYQKSHQSIWQNYCMFTHFEEMSQWWETLWVALPFCPFRTPIMWVLGKNIDGEWHIYSPIWAPHIFLGSCIVKDDENGQRFWSCNLSVPSLLLNTYKRLIGKWLDQYEINMDNISDNTTL